MFLLTTNKAWWFWLSSLCAQMLFLNKFERIFERLDSIEHRSMGTTLFWSHKQNISHKFIYHFSRAQLQALYTRKSLTNLSRCGKFLQRILQCCILGTFNACQIKSLCQKLHLQGHYSENCWRIRKNIYTIPVPMKLLKVEAEMECRANLDWTARLLSKRSVFRILRVILAN